jgi:hypothetical protein
MILAVCCIVLSFILGGRGADSTAKSLADSKWSKDTSSKAFNGQAYLTLFALGLIVAGSIVGVRDSRATHEDPCVRLLTAQLARPHPDLALLKGLLATCEAARS